MTCISVTASALAGIFRTTCTDGDRLDTDESARRPFGMASSSPHRDVYTTVMNWTSHNSVTYEGQTYGQKATEFKQFIDLPSLVKPAVLELAIGSGKNERTPTTF